MGSDRSDPAGPRACLRLPFVASLRPLRAGFGAVLRTGLLATAHPGGVQGRPDHLVPDAGEVLHAAPAYQHDRVLLEVVADAGDVGGDLDARGQTDASDLAKRGVRFLGRGGVDARADAAALRRAPKRGALRLRPRALAPVPDKLLYGRHSSLVCTLALVAPDWFRLQLDPAGRAQGAT